MKKRLLVITLLMALVTLMLAGCGNSENGGASTTGEGETETKASMVKLIVWADEKDFNLVKKMTDDFKKENKGNVALNVVIEKKSLDSMQENVVKDVAAAADVYPIKDDIFMTLLAGGAVDEVSKDSKVKANTVKEANDAFSYNNKQFAYPVSIEKTYCLYYNKKFYEDGDVKKLDDVLSVAASKGKKVSMDMASGDIVYSFFAKAVGLKIGTASDSDLNTCNWNEKTTITKGADVANAMLAVATNKAFVNQKTEDAIKGLKSGSVIACIADLKDAVAIEESLGEDYAAVKLPTYSCGDKDIQMASFSEYRAMAVNYYSENKEWAHKLADYLTNEENQKKFYEETKIVPANKALTNSAEVKENAGVQAVLQQGQACSLFTLNENYWAPTKAFGAEMAKGNKNVQALLDTMVDGIKAAVETKKK